jgi:two-component system phosphate regulon sensor histidine kinase PhoR
MQKIWQIRMTAITMGVGMIGLLVIQFMWFNNAAELEFTNFVNHVNQSLNQTSQDLESRESFQTLLKVANSQEVQEQFNSRQQNLGRSNNNLASELILNETTKKMIEEFPDSMGVDSANLPVKKLQQILADPFFVQSEEFTNPLIREVNRIHQLSMGERISPRWVDSLVDLNLRTFGISRAFEFSISPGTDSLIKKLNSGFFNRVKGDSITFITQLFPNDISFPKYYLTVQFKNQNSYFIQSISNLIISFFFTFSLILLGAIFSLRAVLRLQRLAEMKNDFINNMTHELKTPIATIVLAAEYLKEWSEKSNEPTLTRFSQVILEENSRMQDNVEKILNTSLLEKSDFQLKLSPVNMHEIIMSLQGNNELKLQSKNGHLELHLKAHSYLIKADKTHMINVFNNLVDNAIKYCEGEPVIEITTENNADGLVISIKDNGIGMSPNQQKRAFDKFYRVSTGDLHDVKGFGLGLSYVKFIMENHNGNIKLQSELGKGSTFKLFLPFIQPLKKP